ncbi:MAG: T9SS type A sorting domain-containing protein [Bacteroidota bacterium]
MKSLITNVLLFLFVLPGIAQPTITKDVVFELGSSAPIQFADGYFQPGIAGENVTWDVSSIPTTGDSWTWNALDPATTAFADSFPSANLAFPFPMGDTAENLTYYRQEEDSLFFLGAASSNIGGGGETFFNILEEDPDLAVQFPFTYLSSHTDTYKGINWVEFGGMRVKQFRSATTQRVVDGHGTLTTPFGTFPNAVRVKTTESVTDSLFFVVPVLSTQEITRYTWYAEGEAYILLHMDSIAQINPGFTNVVFSSFYRSGEVTTSMDEKHQAEKWQLAVYPNPASDAMTISTGLPISGPIVLSLHNMVGQEILQEKLTHLQSPQHLSLLGLQPGSYLLRLHTEEGIAAKRIMITP